MGKVVKFKPKPVCTNIWTTCTYDNCPLKALAASLGPTAYLGNCTGYLFDKSMQHLPTPREEKP